MTREEKNQAIEELQAMLQDTNVVYLTDASSLNSADTTKLRGECYKADIKLQVVKNTLLRIAMERTEGREYGELMDVLKGQTALMTGSVGNAPAKLIKEFRKNSERPNLKGAYVEEAEYIGDAQLKAKRPRRTAIRWKHHFRTGQSTWRTRRLTLTPPINKQANPNTSHHG